MGIFTIKPEIIQGGKFIKHNTTTCDEMAYHVPCGYQHSKHKLKNHLTGGTLNPNREA